MGRRKLISDTDLADRVRRVLRRHGYEGMTLSHLAAGTELSKAALYSRFPNGKSEIAGSVLASTSAWTAVHMTSGLFDEELSPTDGWSAFVSGLRQLYDDGAAPCVLALLSAGDAKDEFGSKVSESARRLIASLEAFLRRVGAHEDDGVHDDALTIFMLIQGALVTQRITDDAWAFRLMIDRISAIAMRHMHSGSAASGEVLA